MHVGKFWPVSMINAVRNGNNGFFQTPSRKLAMRFAASGQSGSVAIQWQGLTVVSTVGERWPADEIWTKYTFHHPTNSALKIETRILYKIFQAFAGGPGRSEYEWHSEAFSSATVVARNVTQISLDTTFGGAQYGLSIGPTWGFQPLPALWVSNFTQVGWASWSQQPEYHPYRYEP